jgi:hypothetical protein
MNIRKLVNGFSLLILFFFIAGFSSAQPTQLYHHPSLNIQFDAPPNWMQVPHPEDPMIYELIKPDTTIHVWIYHIVTTQDPPAYLKKVATAKELKFKKEPVKKIIKNKDAWELEANGLIKLKPIHMIITAIPYNNGFFVIQVWTPEPNWINDQQMMRNILGSLGITS